MDTIEVAGRTHTLATLGERLLAQMLDVVIYCAIALVPALILNSIGAVLGVIVALLYLLFQDGLKQGQSYGKRFTKTAVIDDQTGLSCSFWQSFVRNLLLSILGFVDWLFILGTRRQRLGDRLAHTVVIKLSADSPDRRQT